MGWSGSLLRRHELAVIIAAALILTISPPALAQPTPASRVTITIFPVYEGIHVKGWPVESWDGAEFDPTVRTVLERWPGPVELRGNVILYSAVRVRTTGGTRPRFVTLTKPDTHMADLSLVDRLAALPSLREVPREELSWLAEHGHLEVHDPGTVLAPKGQPVGTLWVILSGQVGVRVDRGAGPRRVIEWRSGDVTGMLPFSRMTGPPGDNYTEDTTELLTISTTHFPELIHRCPVFTSLTVHLMLDRARSFNASDLQDEKMISLGKLAAGLAHELNNPASATLRGAKVLRARLAEADSSARALGAAGLPDTLLETIEQMRSDCLTEPVDAALSPLQQATREDEIADWLVDHHMDPDRAATLADTPVSIDALETLATATSGATLDAAIRWIAAGCATHALATDIEQAATRIYELVDAVKKFTYMDNLAGPASADVETGLRDTLRIVASKAKTKGATITLDVDANLPPVKAAGGELNQVWLNLLDNALDAIPESGRIKVTARKEGRHVVVRIADNGPEIASEILPLIFDPFVTTKPPGQGTGLGLDITRRLLRRYHGEISVDSRAGWTEFRVGLVVDSPSASDGGEPTEEDTRR